MDLGGIRGTDLAQEPGDVEAVSIIARNGLERPRIPKVPFSASRNSTGHEFTKEPRGQLAGIWIVNGRDRLRYSILASGPSSDKPAIRQCLLALFTRQQVEDIPNLLRVRSAEGVERVVGVKKGVRFVVDLFASAKKSDGGDRFLINVGLWTPASLEAVGDAGLGAF